MREKRSKLLDEMNSKRESKSKSSSKSTVTVHTHHLKQLLDDMEDVVGGLECWKKALSFGNLVRESSLDITTLSTEELTSFVRQCIEEIKSVSQKRKRARSQEEGGDGRRGGVGAPLTKKPKIETKRGMSDDEIEEESEEEDGDHPVHSQENELMEDEGSPGDRWHPRRKSD